MRKLFLTVFYDPKAAGSGDMVERLTTAAPSLRLGVTYVDITTDRDLQKKYKEVAPVGTVAGRIVFSGEFDEHTLRQRVGSLRRRP